MIEYSNDLFRVGEKHLGFTDFNREGLAYDIYSPIAWPFTGWRPATSILHPRQAGSR